MEVRSFLTWVFALSAIFTASGCGEDAPPPAATPGGPPGAISALVQYPNTSAARRVEVRLLAEPKAGLIVPGGEGGTALITAENIRPSTEGANMTVIKRVMTDDFGKFRIDGIAPGKYLLSAGTYSTGFWREWVTIEPGQTAAPAIKLPARP